MENDKIMLLKEQIEKLKNANNSMSVKIKKNRKKIVAKENQLRYETYRIKTGSKRLTVDNILALSLSVDQYLDEFKLVDIGIDKDVFNLKGTKLGNFISLEPDEVPGVIQAWIDKYGKSYPVMLIVYIRKFRRGEEEGTETNYKIITLGSLQKMDLSKVI